MDKVNEGNDFKCNIDCHRQNITEVIKSAFWSWYWSFSIFVVG